MNLVDLPDELLAQIASFLSPGALVHLQQVSTRFHDIVQSNVALQYALELHVAGMVDNPASRLVPAERLRILRQKEESWRTIDLSDRRLLSLQHNPSGIYDLTGGVLLLGERRNTGSHTGTDSVHTVHLHSAFSNAGGDSRRLSLWRTIDLGQQVIDVGLAIQEHDLIAIVTYSYINSVQLQASINIHLIKHSTGQPHPAAAKPVIHFDNIHYLPGHCSIMLEVAGDTLCFLLNNYFPFVNGHPVTLAIYNWKTGHLVVGQKRLYPDPTMFNSFILLSPDAVALPIIPTNSLEICHFATELAAPPPPPHVGEGPPPPLDIPLLKTTCILELPSVEPDALLLRMTCRCEPNPRGPLASATYADPQVPFTSDPLKALMILHMHFRLPQNTSRLYTLIINRISLLAFLNGTLKFYRRERESRVTDGHPIAQGVLESTTSSGEAGPSPTQSAQDEEVEPLIALPWKDWGPSTSRLFQDELPGTRWITTTCGQRLVRVRSHNGRMRLHVFDFNKLAIKRMLHARALLGEPFGTRPGESILQKGFTRAHRRGGRHADGDDVADVDMDAVDDGGGMGDDPIAVGWLPDLEGDPQDPDDDTGEVGLNDEDDEDEHGDDDEAAVQQSSKSSGTTDAALALGGLAPVDPKRKVRVMLGKTVIPKGAVWSESLESTLPYMETSVRITEDYESVLLDEDVIIGLKMDPAGRHITEVGLHRIGGPVS
ncbi:hypothetical protein C8Q80DRAFT_1121358 [Daedaleopsis nitida]|nr:hypothetical protein C8Q80DRAFT_1121358 [Daedaleopsis nitida]